MLIWSEEVQRDNRRRKLLNRLNLSDTVNIGHGERNRDLEGKTDSEIERTGKMKMKMKRGFGGFNSPTNFTSTCLTGCYKVLFICIS